MKSTFVRLSFSLVALHCAQFYCHAAQFVIIARSTANSWAFYDADTLKVNGKDKLKFGSAQKLTLSADEYKHLPSQQISQNGLLQNGFLRRHANGYLVRKASSGWEPVAPDGFSLNASTDYQNLWRSAPVEYQADRSNKTFSQLRPDEVVFAVLLGPDRDAAVADFLANENNFIGVGEADGKAAFNERMALLKFAAQKLRPPATEKLQQILLSRMNLALSKVKGGLAHRSDLDDGLDYAKVSAEAFPNESRQQKCRKELDDLDKWLNVRTIVLRTLAAGEQWDDFLTKYDDFDRWRNSYPDIRDLKEHAFAASARQHEDLGQQYVSTKQWDRALYEFRLARRYLPNDRDLATLIDDAKGNSDRQAVKTPPPDPDSTAQTFIKRRLSKAKSEIGEGKLDDAEQDIKDASRQDPTSIRVLLAQADLARARKKYQEAQRLLDDYDRKAKLPIDVDDGIELRTLVEKEYRNRVAELKDAINKAKDSGDYKLFAQSAGDATALDPQDPDLLHAAAMGSAVTRDLKGAAKYQALYIKRLALTPKISDAQVNEAYEQQALYSGSLTEPQGVANWFSGYKSAQDVFYCPISLMPNPHIQEIRAGRQVIKFRWERDRLTEIDRTLSEPPEKDGSLWFEYRPDQPGVWRAADNKSTAKEEPPAHYLFTPAGVGVASSTAPIKSNWNYLDLLNSPDVDPAMVKRLFGKQIAILISGNLYFQPFEWNGVYLFLAEYDDQGRVKSATLIANEAADAGRYRYEFSWNGTLLDKITSADYQRQMRYEGGKLMSETVSSRGKNSEIRYNWVNGRLVSAKSGDDAGGKSRDVTFQ